MIGTAPQRALPIAMCDIARIALACEQATEWKDRHPPMTNLE